MKSLKGLEEVNEVYRNSKTILIMHAEYVASSGDL